MSPSSIKMFFIRPNLLLGIALVGLLSGSANSDLTRRVPCAVEGTLVCIDQNSFGACQFGSAIPQAVAPGTRCIMVNGAAVIAHAEPASGAAPPPPLSSSSSAEVPQQPLPTSTTNPEAPLRPIQPSSSSSGTIPVPPVETSAAVTVPGTSTPVTDLVTVTPTETVTSIIEVTETASPPAESPPAEVTPAETSTPAQSSTPQADPLTEISSTEAPPPEPTVDGTAVAASSGAQLGGGGPKHRRTIHAQRKFQSPFPPAPTKGRSRSVIRTKKK